MDQRGRNGDERVLQATEAEKEVRVFLDASVFLAGSMRDETCRSGRTKSSRFSLDTSIRNVVPLGGTEAFRPREFSKTSTRTKSAISPFERTENHRSEIRSYIEVSSQSLLGFQHIQCDIHNHVFLAAYHLATAEFLQDIPCVDTVTL